MAIESASFLRLQWSFGRKAIDNAAERDNRMFTDFPIRNEVLEELCGPRMSIVTDMKEGYCQLLVEKSHLKPSERSIELKIEYDCNIIPSLVKCHCSELTITFNCSEIDVSSVLHSAGLAVFDLCQATVSDFLMKHHSTSPVEQSLHVMSATDTTVILMVAGGALCQILKLAKRYLSRPTGVNIRNQWLDFMRHFVYLPNVVMEIPRI